MKKQYRIKNVIKIFLTIVAILPFLGFQIKQKQYNPFETYDATKTKDEGGKIIFSNMPIKGTTTADTTGGKFRNSFTVEEGIYCAVFLEKELGKYKAKSNAGNKYENKHWSSDLQNYVSKYGVLFDVFDNTGNKVESLSWRLETYGYAEQSSTSFVVNIYIPDNKNWEGNKRIMEEYNKLNPGTYMVKARVIGIAESNGAITSPIASGEFSLIKNENTKLSYGISFNDLKPKMVNLELEGKILNAIQQYGNQQGWKEKFSSVKISVSEFTTLRNKLTGIVVARTISAWIYASWPDGHCTYQDFSFIEDFDGTKYTGKISYYSTGSQTTVDCSK